VKPIRELVPQQGAMCLLEEVLQWDATSIACRATSHRSASNPLRTADGLAAVAGVEYAAQAVAVHGNLTSEDSRGPQLGYLAALRDVICSVERLDIENGDLVVRANQVAAESGRLLYDFRVESGGRELLRGRLSVVLASD
jgi:predicted hotdog family 3-hydroxylacyl-ACP dehydratase